MPEPECCIKSCDNKRVPETTVSFHYMRFDWTVELQGKNAIKEGLTKKIICSKHFKPEFVIERNGREFLVPNAVPTQHLLEERKVAVQKTEKIVPKPNIVKRGSEVVKKRFDTAQKQLPRCSVLVKKTVLKCVGPNCSIINDSHTYVAQISSNSGKSQYMFLCKQHQNVLKSDMQFHLRKNENILSLRISPTLLCESETEEITVRKRTESKKIVEKRATRSTDLSQKKNVSKKSVETQKKSDKDDEDGKKSPSEIWKKIVKQTNPISNKRGRPPKRHTRSTSEFFESEKSNDVPEMNAGKKMKVEMDVICLEDSDSDDNDFFKKSKGDETARCCIPGCKSSNAHSIITVGESPNFEQLTVCLHHRDCFKNIHAMEPVLINKKPKYNSYILEEGEVPPSPEKSPDRNLSSSSIVVASPLRMGENIPVQRVRPTVTVNNNVEVNAQGHTLISRKCTVSPSGSSELFVLEEWSDGSKIYTPAPPGLPPGKCTKDQIAFYKARIPSTSSSIMPTVIPDSNEILSERHIVPSSTPTLPIADISKSELVYIGGKPYLLTGVQGLGLTRDSIQSSSSVQPTVSSAQSNVTTTPRVLSVRSLSDPSTFPRATVVSANAQNLRLIKSSMNTTASFRPEEEEEETILSDHIEPVPVALKRVEPKSQTSTVRVLPPKSNKTTPRMQSRKSPPRNVAKTLNTRRISLHLEKSVPKSTSSSQIASISKNPTPKTNIRTTIQRSPPKTVKPTTIIKTISLNSLAVPKYTKGLEVTSIPAIEDSDNEDSSIDIEQNDMDVEDPSDPLSTRPIETIDLNKDPFDEDCQPLSKRVQKSCERKRGGSLPFPSSLKQNRPSMWKKLTCKIQKDVVAKALGSRFFEVSAVTNPIASTKKSPNFSFKSTTLHFCDSCDILFKSSMRLLAHKKLCANKHTEITSKDTRIYVCGRCQATFYKLLPMFTHIRRCHITPRSIYNSPFSCGYCSHSCASLGEMEAHLEIACVVLNANQKTIKMETNNLEVF